MGKELTSLYSVKQLSDGIKDRSISSVDLIEVCLQRIKKFNPSGITGINPYYGNSKNPWNTSKISGGSSGGSAVAVATGMAPISLATDTGGSIRVPSSLCGVVGLKPTYGRISRNGVMALAPSLDHVGCIVRSAWDAAAVLECISGQEFVGPISRCKKKSSYTELVEDSTVEKISVGIPKQYFFDYLQTEVGHVFYNFIDTIKSVGIPIWSGSQKQQKYTWNG
jgi:aspartyl-tRNA(Asn)/glutamyl-tRNA(Gln) amidotransferase subunit A